MIPNNHQNIIHKAIGPQFTQFSDFLHLEAVFNAPWENVNNFNNNVKSANKDGKPDIKDKKQKPHVSRALVALEARKTQIAALSTLFEKIEKPIDFFIHLIHRRSIRVGKKNEEDKLSLEVLMEPESSKKSPLHDRTLNLEALRFVKIEKEICSILEMDFDKAKASYSLGLILAQEYYLYLQSKENESITSYTKSKKGDNANNNTKRIKNTKQSERAQTLMGMMLDILSKKFDFNSSDRMWLLTDDKMTGHTQEIFWFIYSKAILGSEENKNEAEKNLIEFINHTKYTPEHHYRHTIFGHPEGQVYFECLYTSLYCTKRFYETAGINISFNEENQKLLINELINQCITEPQKAQYMSQDVVEVAGSLWALIIDEFNISDKILKGALKEMKKKSNDSNMFEMPIAHLEKYFLNKEIKTSNTAISLSLANKI